MAGNGGFRPGAGRKPGSKSKLHKATAEEILAHVDETKRWQKLLDSKDENIALKSLIYLTDKRDGKAPQTLIHDKRSDPATRVREILTRITGEVATGDSESSGRPN